MVKTAFDVEKHVSDLDSYGYTIVRDVMPAAEIEATRTAIEETLDGDLTPPRGTNGVLSRMISHRPSQATHHR